MRRGPTLARLARQVIRLLPERAQVPIAYRLASYQWHGEVPCEIAPHARLTIDLVDWVQRLYYFGEREPFKVDVMRQHLPVEGTFLDVGANIGFHTVVMAAHARRGQVVAVEPMNENLERLRINVAVNAFHNVEIVPIGLSDGDDTLTVSAPPGHWGGASAAARVGDPLPGWVVLQTTEVRRLDDVLHVDRLDLVKIDVEGHEVRTLDGARATVDRFRPTIVCEVAGDNQAGVDAWAVDMRYRYQQVGRHGLLPGFVDGTGDVLMTPVERASTSGS